MNRIVVAAICTCIGIGALAYSFGRSDCDGSDSKEPASECGSLTETVQDHTSATTDIAETTDTAEIGEAASASEVESEAMPPVDAEESISPQESATTAGREGTKRLTLQSSMDDGFLVDGVFSPQYEAESFRWTYRVDANVEDGYYYALYEGVAEPGDQGCGESLTVDGVGYSRDTFDPENAVVFRPNDVVLEGDDATQAQFLEALFFSSAIDLLGSIGVTGVAPDADGVWRVSLTANQARSANEQENLLGIFHQLEGISDDTEVHLELVENAEGEVSALRLEFVDVGEPRTRSDGSVQQSKRSFQAELAIEAVSPEEERVTTATPRPQFGYCADRTAGIVGEWTLKESPESEAWFAIDEAGNIAGFAECQSFTGEAEVAFDQLVNVTLSVEGERCSDEEISLEMFLVEVLTEDPRVWIESGELVLYLDDGPYIVLEPK